MTTVTREDINEAEYQGETWMEDRLIEAEERGRTHQWVGMDRNRFSQALSNANCHPFPEFEQEEEVNAAYDAAWDELQRHLVECVEDLCYSVGFSTEGEDLETLVLEADEGETIQHLCERLWEHRDFTPEGA